MVWPASAIWIVRQGKPGGRERANEIRKRERERKERESLYFWVLDSSHFLFPDAFLDPDTSWPRDFIRRF